MIYYNNDKWFLVLVIDISLLYILFLFFPKAENNRFKKKASWSKFWNIFCFIQLILENAY